MTWTTPRTWVAGEKPSASTLNTHIRDNFGAIGDARTAFTPTTANITLGNGTLTGALTSAGKLFHSRMKFVLGSTSAITGSPTFTFGVTAVASRTVVARAVYWDDSASATKIGGGINTSTTVLNLRDDASAALSSTNPFTWATSDEIIIEVTGEAA